MSNRRLLDKIESWTRFSHLSFPVPAHAKNLGYCLGGITLMGFVLLFGTGLFLTQFFNPQEDSAHESVRYIMEEVTGGGWVRSFHYWTAQAVVLSMCAHLLRVFVSGSYKFPRVLTWIFGVGLFFTATLLSYFSGTVIKWDQEGSEAMEHFQVVAEMLGPLGTVLGAGLTDSVSLNIRMFGFHVTLAPLLLVFLVVGHFYLIHVFNISPLPRGPHSKLDEVPEAELTGTFTQHLWAIVRFSLIFYGLIAALSAVVSAPLGDEPTGEATGVKPPWIYYWQYGIENFVGMSGILYSTVILLLLFLLVPFLDRGASRDPKDRKSVLALGAATGLVILGLTVYGWLSPDQVHEGHGHGHEHGQETGPETMPEMDGMDGMDGMPMDEHSHDPSESAGDESDKDHSDGHAR